MGDPRAYKHAIWGFWTEEVDDVPFFSVVAS